VVNLPQVDSELVLVYAIKGIFPSKIHKIYKLPILKIKYDNR